GLLGLILLLLMWPRSNPPAPSQDEEPSLKDRLPRYPEELVAVLGDDRGRHWGPVRSLAFRPDGGLIASGGRAGLIHLWDPNPLGEEALIPVQTGAIHSIAFSPDGKQLLSCGADGTMRLWDLASRKELRRFVGHAGGTVFFSADGRHALNHSGTQVTRHRTG